MTRISNNRNESGVSPSENLLSIEALLQTHNDLILAIHKSFTESYSNINRSITNLTDEVKQLKSHVQNQGSSQSDGAVKEELTNWRSHTETIMKMQEERHKREVDTLMEIFKKFGTGSSANTNYYDAAPAQQPFYSPEQLQQWQFVQAYNQQLAMLTQQPQQQASIPVQAQTSSNIYPQVQSVPSKPTFPSSPSVPKPSDVVPVETPKAKPQLATSLFGAKIEGTAAKVEPTPAKAEAQAKQSESKGGNLDQFKPKPGSWSCTGCLVNNPAEVSVCPCCQTGKDGKAAPAKSTILPTPSANQSGVAMPNFKFGFSTTPAATPSPKPPTATTTSSSLFGGPPSFGASSLFGASAQSQTKTTSSIFGPSNPSTPTPTGSIFGGGSPISANASASPAAPKTSLFGGGAGRPSGASSFASLASNAPQGGSFLSTSSSASTTQANKAKDSPFGEKSLMFQQKPAESKKKGEGSDDENEEFVPDAHFEPVVPLPELVEARTGEEDEDIMFVARCKLYRFDKETKENKERGVGEIKILKHKHTGRYRCLMRRDQVLKLCANFPIHANFKVTPKPHMPTAYYWACKDYSEDMVNGSDEVLCARFKDAQIAQDFFNRITSAAAGADAVIGQKQLAKPSGPFAGTSSGSSSSVGQLQPSGSPLSRPMSKAVPDLLEHSAGKNKSALEKEYDGEHGGYDDEYDDEEGEDEDDEQLLMEDQCHVLVSDEFISPMKKADSSGVPRRCKFHVYDSNGVIRIAFFAVDSQSGATSEDNEFFSHYIYTKSIINDKGMGMLDYRATDSGSAAAKKLDLRFDNTDTANRFKEFYLKGIKMAVDVNFNEEEDQA